MVNAVLDAPSPKPHFLLSAVAGSGKTTVLTRIVHGLRVQRPDARVLLLAFNTENAEVVRTRLTDTIAAAASVGGCVDVHTVHAFGLRLLRQARSDADQPAPAVDPDKAYRTWRRLVRPTARPGAAMAQEWAAVRRRIDAIRHRGKVDPGPRPQAVVRASEPRSRTEQFFGQPGTAHCRWRWPLLRP